MGRKKKYEKRGRPPKHKPVYIVEMDNVAKSYEEAALKVGGNRGDVLLCLMGDRKTHKGHTFEYVAGEEDSE